jgi:hypothetical protein
LSTPVTEIVPVQTLRLHRQRQQIAEEAVDQQAETNSRPSRNGAKSQRLKNTDA